MLEGVDTDRQDVPSGYVYEVPLPIQIQSGRSVGPGITRSPLARIIHVPRE